MTRQRETHKGDLGVTTLFKKSDELKRKDNNWIKIICEFQEKKLRSLVIRMYKDGCLPEVDKKIQMLEKELEGINNYYKREERLVTEIRTCALKMKHEKGIGIIRDFVESYSKAITPIVKEYKINNESVNVEKEVINWLRNIILQFGLSLDSTNYFGNEPNKHYTDISTKRYIVNA